MATQFNLGDIFEAWTVNCPLPNVLFIFLSLAEKLLISSRGPDREKHRLCFQSACWKTSVMFSSKYGPLSVSGHCIINVPDFLPIRLLGIPDFPSKLEES